jgi:methylenetetrahydrofolate reductase (NADPH)
MLSQGKFSRTFSFEFFPPNTAEGQDKLRTTVLQLAQLNPKFFSVTFGAGGSTRERTLGTVLDIRTMGHAAAPHISCVAATRASVREWLQRYQENGIRHLVALRGDLPSGLAAAGDFRYANELIEFIREEFGDAFSIEVAAYPEYHPQAKTPTEDLRAFKRKVDAGADAAITQYFGSAKN